MPNYNNKFPQSKTIFLGFLPFDITIDEVNELCSQYGEVRRTQLNDEKGYAFVSYSSFEEAAEAVQGLDWLVYGENQLKCNFANDFKEPHRSTPNKRVYLGNLPEKIRLEEVKELCSTFGKITRVEMFHGFALISFLTLDDATAAIEGLNYRTFQNEVLMSDYAREQYSTPKSSSKTTTAPGKTPRKEKKEMPLSLLTPRASVGTLNEPPAPLPKEPLAEILIKKKDAGAPRKFYVNEEMMQKLIDTLKSFEVSQAF